MYTTGRKRKSTQKISVKLASNFGVLLLLSWCLIFICFYQISNWSAQEQAENISHQTMTTIEHNVTNLIDNVAYYSKIILSSNAVTEALEEKNGELQKQALHQFFSMVDSKTHINGIYIWDFANHASSIDRNQVRVLRTENVKDAKWYEEVCALKGSYCLKVNADRVLTKSGLETAVSLIRVINSPIDYQPIGILMLNIDISAFENCVEDALSEDGEILYLLDNTGKVVNSQSSVTIPALKLKLEDIRARAALPQIKINNRKMYLAEHSIEPYGWQIISGVRVKNILGTSGMLTWLLVLAILFLAVFCVINFLMTRKYIAKPLETLTYAMNQMRGKKFEKIEILDGKIPFVEMNVLKNTYNDMVDEIDKLIQRVYDEEKIKRKTELNALQEQMKPHFLYNTIDAMGYLALSGKNEEVYDALEAFGGYYRTLLSKGKEIISVKEEMQMVKDYLNLQKIRYGESLRYVIEIDKAIWERRILKMILQPFVENSVNHGIRQKGTYGCVYVTGYEENGYLVFSVEDDGVGMSKEKVAELMGDSLDTNEKSFGFRGTIERMKIFYDTNIEYEIKSSEKQGTMICLRVPIYYEGENDNDKGSNCRG